MSLSLPPSCDPNSARTTATASASPQDGKKSEERNEWARIQNRAKKLESSQTQKRGKERKVRENKTLEVREIQEIGSSL